MPTLHRVKAEINAGKHSELRTAEIHRGIPRLIRATLAHPSKPFIQPHTRLVVERMKRVLDERLMRTPGARRSAHPSHGGAQSRKLRPKAR